MESQILRHQVILAETIGVRNDSAGKPGTGREPGPFRNDSKRFFDVNEVPLGVVQPLLVGQSLSGRRSGVVDDADRHMNVAGENCERLKALRPIGMSPIDIDIREG